MSIVYRFDDDGQEDLSGYGVYVDPEYNILWSYSPKDNKMSCFNPIAANIEGIVNLNLTHLTLMASIQVGSRGYPWLVMSLVYHYTRVMSYFQKPRPMVNQPEI